MHDIYIEYPVEMAFSDGAAVWSFEPELWGTCVQGASAGAAVAAWMAIHGPSTIVETIRGDEQAFQRDFEPASEVELERTLAILATQRSQTVRLLDELPADVLDREDPDREMPDWAGWRTIRQMMWHICDTESRYYLPRTGLPARDRRDSLREELVASQRHVKAVLTTMPRDLAYQSDGEVWTTVKLLRRLAWHERGELEAIKSLLAG